MKLQYSPIELLSYEHLSLDQLLLEEDGVFRVSYNGKLQSYCFVVVFRGHALYYGSDYKDVRPTSCYDMLEHCSWTDPKYSFKRVDLCLPDIPHYLKDLNVPEEDWVDEDEDGDLCPPEIQLW